MLNSSPNAALRRNRREPDIPFSTADAVFDFSRPELTLALLYDCSSNLWADFATLRREKGVPSHYRLRIEKNDAGTPWVELSVWRYDRYGHAVQDRQRRITARVAAHGQNRGTIISALRRSIGIAVLMVEASGPAGVTPILDLLQAGELNTHPGAVQVAMLDGMLVFGSLFTAGY